MKINQNLKALLSEHISKEVPEFGSWSRRARNTRDCDDYDG